MKKALIISLTLILGLFTMNCSEDVTPSYILTLNITLPDGFTAGTLPDGITVKATNSQTGRETTATADASGVVIFELVQGSYDFTSSFEITDGEDNYTFNGVLLNYSLIAETTESLQVVLAGNSGDFIFKEVYFSGSQTPEGKNYYGDQFHELYNNSGDTLYLDGLCLGVLQPTSTSESDWVKEDGVTLMDELPLNYHVWIFPGSGTDNPVLPGESVIVAHDGIDHKDDAEYGNPGSPVNLGNADWETYVEISGKDLDAPGVPNLTMMYTNSSTMVDWLHPVRGAAVVIFRLPVDWETYVNNPDNFKTRPGSTSTRQYFMVNKDYVVDAIEIVRVEEDKRHKRLQVELDAGYTYLDGGSYCSKSIRRKAKMIVDGRVIYKDTNNSTEDFLHDLDPTPGIHPTTVED